MLAWYVVITYKLDLDMDKIMKYCLIHDIVEIYAGDVDALRRSPEQQALKEEKEQQAMIKIAHEFPEGHELWKRLEAYEHREDEEAKFVYALDKLIPVLNIYNDGGRWRRQRKAKLDDELVIAKAKKMEVDPTIKILWEDLYKRMKENEHQLFDI